MPMGNIKNLQKALKDKNLDGLIITNPVNIFYLLGFRGVSPTEREATLVVTLNTATLISARLYQQEALKLKSKDLDVKISQERREFNGFIKDVLDSSRLRSNNILVGFEEHDLKFSEFREFKKLLKGAKFVPIKHLVEGLRIIKTADEIKNIERAQLISQKAFEQVLKTIKVGQHEAEIAENLAKIMKSLGAQGLAFESIIASGPNSALPHYVTGNRQLKAGDTLLLDFGTKYKNYCADLSRTVFF